MKILNTKKTKETTMISPTLTILGQGWRIEPLPENTKIYSFGWVNDSSIYVELETIWNDGAITIADRADRE